MNKILQIIIDTNIFVAAFRSQKGVANLLLHLPLVLAVGHNMGAALLLTTVVVLNSKITEAKQR